MTKQAVVTGEEQSVRPYSEDDRPKPPSVFVGGVPLLASPMQVFVASVVQLSMPTEFERTVALISATGAHGIVHANDDPEFMQLLNSFYMNLPDGMPGVWVGRLKGAREMERCYGPAFFASVMRESASLPIRHYFCGGKEGVADRLREAVAQKFGNHNVVGTHCPPFRPLEEEEFAALGKEIDQLGADFVWIGISTPKQEWFAYRLSRHTRAKFIATVGAAFDFHIGAVRQAPPLLQKAGLEWLFRLAMEPRRLYKRYFKIVPQFIYLNIRDLVRHLMHKDDRTENPPNAAVS